MSAPIACVQLPELPIVAHPTAAAATATSPRAALPKLDARRLAEAQRRVVGRLIAVSPRIAIAGADRFWVEPTTAGMKRGTWNMRAFQAWSRDVGHVVGSYGPVLIGIGPTATVAWAAARSVGAEGGHRFVPPEHARAFLDQAPLEALEIDGATLDILASLGIRRVRELRALDPVSLGMRFGPAVADARRRADGFDPRQPITPSLTDAPEVRLDLDDDITELEPLLFLLRPAAERLASDLRLRDEGVVHLKLELAPHRTLSIRTGAALAEGQVLMELLRTRLEREQLGGAVSSLRLWAEEVVPRKRSTEPLFRHAPPRDRGSQEVALDRLRHRLGEASLRRAERVEAGPVLERARWLFARDLGVPRGGEAMPWRQLDPPAPVTDGRVRVGGKLRRVVRMGRVERAGAPWWDGGEQRVSLVAWAELEGPLLALMHARCGTDCDDRWEVLAWVD
jgi:nucleotidyltransferase/DNA polymerase involved in DNA repair